MQVNQPMSAEDARYEPPWMDLRRVGVLHDSHLLHYRGAAIC